MKKHIASLSNQTLFHVLQPIFFLLSKDFWRSNNGCHRIMGAHDRLAVGDELVGLIE